MVGLHGGVKMAREGAHIKNQMLQLGGRLELVPWPHPATVAESV